MVEEFKKHGIDILNVYFCPHSPEENCDCRKPKIGMILQSQKDFEIDLINSWLIGDKITDIETAVNANISNNILISQKKDYPELLNIANNLLDTINIIKK
ncbi:D,D-heptose 1,7-bisphosphate phosphatase [Arcobacter defluvii]|uniref:D,D-heptose 1,7-bisphosphate phosphatase n=2 Tax=Arcobacter defluvii TaxID=873191 RepID=A0AAE7E842_9BACT|nr:D,D-heptose 1,7-bisphosphate phosphatase [Arcobacter defluvii]